MCVIVVKKPEVTLLKRTIKTCFTNNPEGAGFMYAHKGRLFVEKGFMCFRKFYRTFRQHEKSNPKSIFVLHFRIAACGPAIPENTHPFYINPNIAIVHNGVISELGDKDTNDTFIFAKNILARLPEGWFYNPTIIKAIEELAQATFSKFVLMDNSGKIIIINEKAGVWNKGIWYSNSSYQLQQLYANFASDEWTKASAQGFDVSDSYIGMGAYGYRGISTSGINNARTDIESSICSICYKTTWDIKITTWISLVHKVIKICRSCWDERIPFISIACPNCSMSVTPQHNICPFCYFEIDDSYLAEQLYVDSLSNKNPYL